MKTKLKENITDICSVLCGNHNSTPYLNGVVDQLEELFKEWALECVEKDTPYVEEGYNVGNENWLDYNARITQENRLKQEIRERFN